MASTGLALNITNMTMSPFILSQMLAGIALCSDIVSFQFKQKKHIINCLIISSTAIAFHFMLLEKWTAAIVTLVAAIRFITTQFTTKKRWLLLFISVTLVIGVITYAGILSILSTTAVILGTLATFCTDDKPMRRIMAFCTSLWIIHNILAGSPTAVVLESLFLTSNLIGYFRYYVKPTKQQLN